MIRRWLERSPDFVFSVYAIVAAFGTYLCMYAFRKPFAVGLYEEVDGLGMLSFKAALIISQVLGYAMSKFIGIKVISELSRKGRIWVLLALIGIAEVALLFFGFSFPNWWSVGFLFLNGLPLGMIWGIVFSYLEGRRFSEILGAGLSASFIVGSGVVKSTGKWLIVDFGIAEHWMPFATGMVYLVPLILCAIMLEQIPEPTSEDEAQRTKRQPMGRAERRAFFSKYAFGLVVLIAFYILLTAYRDFRDNFAAELWMAIGFADEPAVFTLSEIPIAVIVLAMLGLTMFIQNNQRAFFLYHRLLIVGAIMIGVSTWAFAASWLPGAVWLVLVGLGLYVGYVPYNCILFDRMIAAVRQQSNAGYLIYVADAFGYAGSVAILLYKDFGAPELSWLDFFMGASYAVAILGVVLVVFAYGYFQRIFRTIPSY